MPLHQVSGKIDLMASTGNLSEESQATKMQYALVNKSMGMIHQFVLCKDFLNDAVAGHLNKRNISIYGFTYKPDQKNSPNFDRTSILLRFPKNALNIDVYYRSLYRLEHMCGIKEDTNKTRMFDMAEMTTAQHRFVLASGSDLWMKSPVLLSLYTLLLRLSNHRIPETTEELLNFLISERDTCQRDNKPLPKEVVQGITVVPYMKGILENRVKLFGDKFDPTYYPDSINTSWHNNCGVVSLITNRNPKVNKNQLDKILNIVPKKGKIKDIVVSKKVGFDIWKRYLYNSNNTQVMGFVRKDGKARSIVSNPIDHISGMFVEWSKALLDKDSIFDKTMTRLLFSADYLKIDKHKERMFLAKRILNVYEEAMGIKKKTVISSAEIKGIEEGSSESFLLTSDITWFSAPMLTHLYISTIRSLVITKYDVTKVKTPSTIDDAIKVLEFALTRSNLSIAERPFVHLIKFIIKNSEKLLQVEPAKEYPTTFQLFSKQFITLSKLPKALDNDKSRYTLEKLTHWEADS